MQPYKSSSKSILKNTSIISILNGLGVASGLILDALILSTFGIGYQTDAFFTALSVPLLLTSVFSVQCPKVLIPVFAEYFGRNDQAAAWGLLSNLVTTGFFVFVGISFAGMALSGVIVLLQIPGLESEAISLAVWLSRILFWLVLCQGLSSILQSVLYSQQCFLISSSGKLVTNSLTIVVVVLGHDHFGVKAVAAGMLLGGYVQVAVLALALFAHGFQYRWVLRPTGPKLQEIARLFCYPLTGHILSEAGMILQNFLGSFLGSGNLTVVRYASRIVQSIAGIFLGSVVQVTFPLVSKHAATNDLRAQRKTLLESIQLLSVVGLPICIWLIVTAEPMLMLLFERGAFSRADAVLTGVIIGLMAPDILLSRIGSIAQTLFYANKDMRTPFISTLIYAFSHTILAILLVRLLGVLGLPIAVSLASLSYAIYMITKVQSRFGPIGWSELWGFAFRLSAAGAVAVVGFTLGGRLAPITTVSYSLAKLLDFSVPTAFGIFSFIMSVFLFRLLDGRFFLPGGERHSLFFDRSS
jgi:putative peptidoglycan lipid II flippase